MTSPVVVCSPFTRACLNMQGFAALSDEAKAQYTWALRFTPGLCTVLVILGLALQSWPLLFALLAIALVGAIFPAGHPFDLVYNYGIRHLFRAEALPPTRRRGASPASWPASFWLPQRALSWRERSPWPSALAASWPRPG